MDGIEESALGETPERSVGGEPNAGGAFSPGAAFVPESPPRLPAFERAANPQPVPLPEVPPLDELLEEALTPGPELEDGQALPQEELDEPVFKRPRFVGAPGLGTKPKSKSKSLQSPEALQASRLSLTPQQRLLLLDTWRRSGLPAGDFAALVGVSKQALYTWKKAFDEQGPAGLLDKPRGGPRGMKLPELTKRTILMLKETNPDWGCQRISDMLLRGPALPACPATVAKVLHDAGYQTESVPTKPHPDKVRSFERARANQLWQTDLFTFVLKRQNRRVYLVAFMDDHSRFIVSYGLHASQSTALVLEVFRAGITSHGAPEEVLTDNGAQYITWRGKSVFTKECEKRGINQIVAAPRRPQTLGKIERFWGTLWRECLEAALFLDLGEARTRIGHFIDHYNFQRPHQGLDGLVPADRFFGAAPEVLRTLKERVAANALELARHGVPKAPFYLTGQVGGKGFSVHAEGERMILTREAGAREEIALTAPPEVKPVTLPAPLCPEGVVLSELSESEEAPPPEPGVSALDESFPPNASATDGGGA